MQMERVTEQLHVTDDILEDALSEKMELKAISCLKEAASDSSGELPKHITDQDMEMENCLNRVENVSEMADYLHRLAENLQPPGVDNPVMPSVVLSLVRDLMFCFSEHQSDKLKNVDVSFTCKLCQAKKSSLREVIQHLDCDNCKQAKRGRGRPRKYPLPPGVKPEKHVKKIKQETAPQILEPSMPGRRTTRISTGSIKRKSAAELLGIKMEVDDDEGDDADDMMLAYEADNIAKDQSLDSANVSDHTDIVLNLQDILRAANRMNCQNQDSAGCEIQLGKETEKDICHSSANDGTAMINDSNSEMVRISLTQELPSKYESMKLQQKVSLISHSRVNLIPVSAAETSEGQKVITIKPSDVCGNVVIPVMDKLSKSRNVIIPHSLLLNALKEHNDDPKHEMKKTIILIDDTKAADGKPVQKVDFVEKEIDDAAANDNDENDPDFVIKDHRSSRAAAIDDDDDDNDDDGGENDEEEDADDAADGDNHDHASNHGDIKRRKTRSRSIFKRGRPRTSFFEKCTARSSHPHRCNVCIVRYFSTEKELDVHLSVHIYTKEEIDAETNRKVKYAKRELFRCQECSVEIPNWNRILRHMMSHEVYQEKLKGTDSVRNIFGNFLCPVCKKSFDKKYNMIMHWRKIHHKQTRTCEVCKKDLTCVDDKTFSRHVDKCRNVTYQCEHCSYHTTVNMNMRRHMRVHTGNGYMCDVCSKVFPTRQRCMVHQERHKANRPRFSCEVCSKLFLTIDALKKHFARFHVKSDQFFPCPKCKYVAKVQSDLPKHDKLVHDKKFKCQHEGCLYMTNSEVSYHQHLEYHGPDRVFPCPYDNCYYSGCTAKQLSDHCTTVHNIQSKHQCPICQKFFKKKTHLLRHLVVHTGDQPYMCLECGQSFYSHSTYYRHRRKTGHDLKREGIASVPQNIIITYLQEDGREESTVAFSAKGQMKKDDFAEEDASFHNILLTTDDSSVQLSMTNNQVATTQDTAITSDQVVFIETTDTQVMDDISKMTQNQSLSILSQDNESHVIQRVPLQDDILNDNISVVAANMPSSADIKMIGESDILSNMITIPDGDGQQQYTYVLSSEQSQNLISRNQVTLNLPEGAINMDSLSKPIGKDLVQEVLYGDGVEGNIGHVVEVTPPGDDGQNGQFAILLVPSVTRDEADTTTNLLQLQTQGQDLQQ
ncbi:hypothetical protein LSH36_436g06057 [Paralvinella palmiformis]|uniref:C2H2-type domain-containing protein n=1 Tax=Paralvinella palmiformis TaxID=53620 RepID=A0AAD9JC17_9ANNE|nr:hypothetical protein LSH36_436g06057 [Paralvinella palmiformis]